MRISNSVNRHLGQSDYTNISNSFYTFNINIYFPLSSTAEIMFIYTTTIYVIVYVMAMCEDIILSTSFTVT